MPPFSPLPGGGGWSFALRPVGVMKKTNCLVDLGIRKRVARIDDPFFLRRRASTSPPPCRPPPVELAAVLVVDHDLLHRQQRPHHNPLAPASPPLKPTAAHGGWWAAARRPHDGETPLPHPLGTNGEKRRTMGLPRRLVAPSRAHPHPTFEQTVWGQQYIPSATPPPLR